MAGGYRVVKFRPGWLGSKVDTSCHGPIHKETMRHSPHSTRPGSLSVFSPINRRHFLLGAAATLATARAGGLAAAFAPDNDHAGGPLKIEALELVELHGSYTEEAGVNGQPQVNPLGV